MKTNGFRYKNITIMESQMKLIARTRMLTQLVNFPGNIHISQNKSKWKLISITIQY